MVECKPLTLVELTIEEPVIITDGYISIFLPEYELKIKQRVKRSTGEGAYYAKLWDKLPSNLMKILQVWLNNRILYERPWEKKHLREQFKLLGLHINEDPMNARISELLALGLISNAHVTGKPHYQIDYQKCVFIMATGGYLKGQVRVNAPAQR